MAFRKLHKLIWYNYYRQYKLCCS